MRFVFSILILLTLFMTSCTDNHQAAMHLNNRITKINDSLYRNGMVWGDEFKIAIKTGDYSRLQDIRMAMEAHIDRSIAEISALEDVAGSEDLREKELEYLKFEKEIVRENFSPFETFNDRMSRDSVESAYNKLMKSSSDEQRLLSDLNALQESYIKENDLPIETK